MTVDLEPDCPPYLRGWTGVELGMPEVLDLFARNELLATVFATGEAAERYPDLIRRIVDTGHELGCHGHTHRSFSTLGPGEAEREIARSAALLRTFAAVTSFRAPYLDFPERYIPLLEAHGFTIDASLGRYKPAHWFRTPAVRPGPKDSSVHDVIGSASAAGVARSAVRAHAHAGGSFRAPVGVRGPVRRTDPVGLSGRHRRRRAREPLQYDRVLRTAGRPVRTDDGPPGARLGRGDERPPGIRLDPRKLPPVATVSRSRALAGSDARSNVRGVGPSAHPGRRQPSTGRGPVGTTDFGGGPGSGVRTQPRPAAHERPLFGRLRAGRGQGRDFDPLLREALRWRFPGSPAGGLSRIPSRMDPSADRSLGVDPPHNNARAVRHWHVQLSSRDRAHAPVAHSPQAPRGGPVSQDARRDVCPRVAGVSRTSLPVLRAAGRLALAGKWTTGTA